MDEKQEPAQTELAPVEQDEGALVEIADQELVVPDSASLLFGTNDPIQVIESARRVVSHMEKLIKPRRKEFVAWIEGRECPMDPWWTAMGQSLGLTPVLAWTRPFEPLWERSETYESRTEVFHRSGTLISAGQGICAMDELVKRQTVTKTRAEWGFQSYAVYSFSQTRSRVRAYKGPLSFIAILSGLEPIPAEELDKGDPVEFPGDEIDLTSLPDDLKIGLKQLCDKDKWGDGAWGANKCKYQLVKFYPKGGVLDEKGALAHLSRELDKLIAERG